MPSNWRSSDSVTYSHCHRIEIPSCSWWLFEIELPLLFTIYSHLYRIHRCSFFGLVFDMFCLFSVNVGVECNQRQIYIYHTQRASDFRQMFIRIITIQWRIFFVLFLLFVHVVLLFTKAHVLTHKYQNINRSETIIGFVYSIHSVSTQLNYSMLFSFLFRILRKFQYRSIENLTKAFHI